MLTKLLHELAGLALLAVFTGFVFALGEMLRRRGRLTPEQSRKMLHIGGCATAFAFPFLFTSHWTVLAICGGFFLLIAFLGRRGALHAVSDVERKSYGSLLHPVALYICYRLADYNHNFAFYEIAILVLALSDTAAAFVGQRYGHLRYRVDKKDFRTLEGSVFFFLVTYALVHHILLLALKMAPLEATALSLMIAILVTLFEAVSLGGADNIAVPLGVMAILIKNAHPCLHAMTEQLVFMGVSFAVTCAAMRLFGVMEGSGRVVTALLVYLSAGLISPWWGVMTLIAAFLVHCSHTLRLQEVRTVFALWGVPFLTVMAFNLAEKLAGWRNLVFATPVYALVLLMSCFLVRQYEKR